MKLRNIPFLCLSKVGFYNEIRFRTSGCDAEEPYYIIRRANRWGEAGFFSNYFYAIKHFAYGLKKGYRPVIDMLNYSTLYSERKGIEGEYNAWNYYFSQPYTTKDAYESRRFILSDSKSKNEFSPILETDETCSLNQKIAPSLLQIVRTFLPIRPEIERGFEAEFENLFHGSRVLGIHYRGGDKHTPPAGHRRSISEEALCQAVASSLKKCSVGMIFLASDEEGIADVVRSMTNVPTVELNSLRLSHGSTEGLHLLKNKPRPHHRYMLGIEVLRDAWFLSRCNTLVCGYSNASNAALFFNGKPYDDLIVINTGYPINR